ncbi:MAG TPA: GNVR domain-containing protein [Nitrospira sp.]|nr:GNVR domain-containing protein [Nitrospira sp.]
MNQTQAFERETSRSPLSIHQLNGSGELTWLDLGSLIRKRIHVLSAVVVLATAGGIGISLLLPKIYESTATLLPQLESKDAGGLGSLLAASGVANTAQTLGVNLPGMTATPTDIFLSILKSRTMADDVVNRFSLKERYEAIFMQDARSKLEGVTRFAVTKEKVIKITVEDKDPAIAAAIANFYVSNLDRLNRTMGVTKASDNRKFVEERLKETEEALANAEEALKEFQTRHRTVAIEAQSKAMIEAAATLQAQITAQEVQLQVMGAYLSRENPELIRVRSSIEELRKQLALMESGKSGKRMSGDQLHPAIIAVPTLALEYGRLMRNLKVQETLYTLLMSQYEQAKLSEARDTPTVQVLDAAVPAERKSRPRVMLNGLLAGAAALLLGMMLILFLEWRTHKKDRLSSLQAAA